MAHLNEKIAKLEAEIEGYVIDFKNVTTLEEKKIYAGLINTARETLNILLEEKKAQFGGKLSRLVIFDLFYSSYSFYLCMHLPLTILVIK